MTIAEQVEAILQHVPITRSSDKELFIIYALKSGLDFSERQLQKLREMPSFETLRRIRQKIQAEGKYQATDKVRLERKMKAMIMQQTEPTTKAANLEKTLTYRPLPWGE